jgi:hypothetical protein
VVRWNRKLKPFMMQNIDAVKVLPGYIKDEIAGFFRFKGSSSSSRFWPMLIHNWFGCSGEFRPVKDLMTEE